MYYDKVDLRVDICLNVSELEEKQHLQDPILSFYVK